jgi:hypothetical protein
LIIIVRVEVKLSPSSDYEGIEPLSEWTHNPDDTDYDYDYDYDLDSGRNVPEIVLKQLESPELVVVRVE